MELQEYKSFISELRLTVECEVAQVGGYWPVRQAIAVVGQELGFGARYALDGNQPAFAKSMFNAFWLLTCIANQYCCDLASVGAAEWELEDPMPEEAGLTLRDATLLAFAHYGRILRIVNRYEDGISLDDDATLPIAGIISRIQRAILVSIGISGTPLDFLLRERLQIVRSYRTRPDIPATPRFDPSTSESLNRFRAVAMRTACPFAKSAKIWATPPWRRYVSADKFMELIEPTLERFSRVGQAESFDGLVIECFGVTNMDELRRRTRQLLIYLGRYSSNNPLAKDVERRDWRFTLMNVETFVTIFSSIYASHHPRYSHSAESTFFFFQPQSSFKAKQAKDKAMIRARFKEAGQDYTQFLKKVRFEAQKFIKPDDLYEGEPVVWWQSETSEGSEKE